LRAATDPNPRSAVNRTHAGWQAYYLFMYLFGFFLGCANIVVCACVIYYAWHCAWILVFLPVAVILGIGPFFSPLIGIKIGREQAWLHRCDTYSVEIVLTGLSFNSPSTAIPTATFSVRQNGILENQYQYGLTNDAVNVSIWRFGPSPEQPLADGQIITYNLDNSSLVATCAGNTGQCTQGSFASEEKGFLSFDLTNSVNPANVKLRAVDPDWASPNNDDAPSFILKEVQPDGNLGEVVMRTAVIQHCTLLKVCANGATVEILAPVGLTLMKQNAFGKVCTTPNSN
ncbi:hypothetical protein B0H13DRAFT_1619348, partial [Mycena leptocephala]